MRRTNSTDEFQHIARVTAEVLHRFGLGEATIQQSIASEYLRSARMLLEAGYPEAALQAAREARLAGAIRSSLRPVLASIHRQLAKGRYRAGHFSAALVSAIQACAVSPGLPFMELHSRVTRLLREVSRCHA